MSDLDDLAPAEAHTSGVVLIIGMTAEGEEISAALRARGFDVERASLSSALGRIADDAPRVVILDVDAPGALDAVPRIHELAGGSSLTVLLVGDPIRTAAELDPHLVGQVFSRPIDLAELSAHVASVAAPVRSHRSRSTPPPSVVAQPPLQGSSWTGALAESATAGEPRAAPDVPALSGHGSSLESDAPEASDFPGEIDPIDVGSMIPGDGSAEGVRIAPSRISPELEQLLAAAEQRVIGGARPSSVPSLDDEVDLMLSPDLLAVLDEPLDPDDDGPGTGPGVSVAIQNQGSAQRLTPGTGAEPITTPERGSGEHGARSAEPSSPGEAPWTTRTDREPGDSAPRSLAHSGAGVWAQGSPFRSGSGVGGVTPVETQRETRETQAEEPAKTASPADASKLAAPPSPDEERWAGGTRDEGDSRREEIEADEAAPAPEPASATRDTDGEIALAHAGAAMRAPLISPPRDVRVRSLSDLPGLAGAKGPAAAPPGFVPDLMGGPAETPRVRVDPIPQTGTRPISDIPLPVDESAALRAAAHPFGVPPAASTPLGSPEVRARAPSFAEESAPSSRAPAVTVLGPGDAPRALARAVGSRASGSLAITADDVTRRIVVHEGDIVTAASDRPDETLLAFLAARGDITRDVAVHLAGKLPSSGRHAGAALIAHGHLGQDDLWPVLRAHAEWIIGHVVLLDGGTCELEDEAPGRLKAEPNVFGGATGAEVFVETIRRVIAPDVALRRLGGAAARLDEGARHALLGECALRREEDDRVRSARGRSVSEIVAATEPEMATLLYALVCLEVLDVLIPPSASEMPRPIVEDPLDDEAIRQRVRARVALVHDGDYFAVLGVERDATSYEIRRAYLALRRTFEPSRMLTAATVDLLDDVRLVIEVVDEAFEILREPHRRERYRRAIEAQPP